MCVTNNITEKSLEKWKDLILACKNYYIDSVPTGMDDAVYDMLEALSLIHISEPTRP